MLGFKKEVNSIIYIVKFYTVARADERARPKLIEMVGDGNDGVRL